MYQKYRKYQKLLDYFTLKNVANSGAFNDEKLNCNWIYGNRSKSHIGSYEIIDFKDFNTL